MLECHVVKPVSVDSPVRPAGNEIYTRTRDPRERVPTDPRAVASDRDRVSRDLRERVSADPRAVAGNRDRVSRQGVKLAI